MAIDNLADFFDGVDGFVGGGGSIEKDGNDGFVALLEGVVDAIREDFGGEVVVF